MRERRKEGGRKRERENRWIAIVRLFRRFYLKDTSIRRNVLERKTPELAGRLGKGGKKT